MYFLNLGITRPPRKMVSYRFCKFLGLIYDVFIVKKKTLFEYTFVRYAIKIYN